MTGSSLFRLMDEPDRKAFELGRIPNSLFDPLSRMADDNSDLGRWCDRQDAVQDVEQERLSTDLMKHLGQGGAHALSKARRQNHHSTRV